MIRSHEMDGGAQIAHQAKGLPALTLPIAVIIGAVAGYVATLPITPAYLANAQLLVGVGGPLAGGMEPYIPGLVQSEVAVLASRELANQAVERHDLLRRLDPGANQSLPDTLLVAAGVSDNPSRATIGERALGALEDNLEVAPVGQSRVIDIRYFASDPKLAADVANALADTFVSDQAIAYQNSDRTSLVWLEKEIARLRERVAEADKRLQRYRSGSDLFSVVGSGGEISLASQELSELNGELARARADHAEAKARAQVVRKILKQGGAVDAAKEVLDSVLIQRLRQQQIDLQSQKAELSSTYLSGHPRIESLQSQLDDLDKQIHSEMRKVLKSVEISADVAGARVTSLRESLNEIKSAASQTNDKGVQLRALERDARSQRELLETFLTRYRTQSAEAGSSFRPSGARIISRAKAPNRPASPNRLLWAGAGALLSLAGLFVHSLFRHMASVSSRRYLNPARHDRDKSGDGDNRDDHEGGDDLADILLEARRRQARHDRFRDILEELDGERTAKPARTRQAVAADDAAGSGHDTDADMPATARSVADVPAASASHADRSVSDHASGGAEAAEPKQPGAQAGREPTEEPEPRWTPLDAPGTAELAQFLAGSPARTILFAGAGPRHGVDQLALAAASRAAGTDRFILLDIGLRPSPLLTLDIRIPGLGDLISGAAPFGQVIRRNVMPSVDVIGMGIARGNPPLKRLTVAVRNLCDRYGKVMLVAHRMEDWPDRFVQPDLAVLVCDPRLDEKSRRALYRQVMKRGAKKALIVRNELVLGDPAGDEEQQAA